MAYFQLWLKVDDMLEMYRYNIVYGNDRDDEKFSG